MIEEPVEPPPDSRRRWAMILVVAFAVLAVAAVAVAVGLDRRPRVPPRPPSPPATLRPSPAATVTSVQTPTTTVAATMAPATSAQEAAERLYRARKANDKDLARTVASESAIGTLWSFPPGDFVFQGCERSGSVTLCSFYEEGTALVMRVDGRADAGFRVSAAEFRPD